MESSSSNDLQFQHLLHLQSGKIIHKYSFLNCLSGRHLEPRTYSTGLFGVFGLINLEDLITKFYPESFRDLIVSAALGGTKMEMAMELKNLWLMQLLIFAAAHKASRYI